ncbi:acyl transferase domain-containing protein [Haloactinomyces albus]|uniref:Acyl transferase domain-containing protein n=1 Tax=Haloactinomyces albus TaxID=1352928 RepID=A0AAE3ZI79_9ACTN|nr:acyl transferase domain-containing protein [Haloactinomyces albus]
MSIDPQQRLMLEVAWEALEHAGVAPDAVRGSRMGVFVGVGGSDYERLNLSAGGVAGVDGYAATGSAVNFVANRVSYALGLEGPSLAVDTACSSSLVALHVAAGALRAGDCDSALVGGVNLLLSPGTTVALSQGRMLSSDGRCRTFDADADGYVRGEGCGVVVVRRLSDALAEGQQILGVVRGTATNQDGRSNGLTAPRGGAQQEVVRRALAVGGVLPSEVGFVEAHGTGTSLGDPIEVRALARVLGQGRAGGDRVRLGSVKTNIGHLEAAAGIAGLIKALLVAERGVVPPHLNVNRLNPLVDWDGLPVSVVRELSAWQQDRRIAGVSSFGFGGTNAHAVIEGPAAYQDCSGGAGGVSASGRGPVVVKVSAASAASLRESARQLADFVVADAEGDLRSVAWAAGVGRADLAERAAVVAGDRGELVGGLRAVAAGGEVAAGVVRGRRSAGGSPRVGFVIPGQGAPLAGVLQGLYGHDATITRVVDEVATVVGPVTRLPLAALLDDGEDSVRALHDTAVAQPALYAAAVALGTWWQAQGIEPEAVVGHSVGAYAAAALTGIFTTTTGAHLIMRRAELMTTLPSTGAMAAVMCPAEDLDHYRAISDGEVSIAAYNGPRETVLSGPRDSVGEITDDLAGRGVRVAPLRVSRAFHSAEMDPILAQLADAFDDAELHEPRPGFLSDTTGTAAGDEVTTAEYWVRHTREPVRFAEALSTMLARRVRVVVELGMGSMLRHVASAAQGASVACLPSVVAGEGAHRRLWEAFARVWSEGVDVDWNRINGPRPPRLPKLPTYRFQRETYWLPGARPTEPPAGHPDANASEVEPRWEPATTTIPAPRLAGADAAADRADELMDWLRRELVGVLDSADLADLDPDTGLFDLGLTSAMVVDLRARLERELGRQLPTTVVFDHPTIRKLAEHLAGGDVAAPAPRTRQRRPDGDEPIAIVGMSCRFPGGANSPDLFWTLLQEGRDATSAVPQERWDVDAFYDEDPSTPGKAHTFRGGFLNVPIDEFDAEAFGISPREARGMDPQQRLLLEVAWEALEDAGCTATDLDGSATSVYIGINTADYLQLMSSAGTKGIDPYLATGNTPSVAAGRLSYFLGTQGPSLAVDTACSSSLVAVHLAARSLRSGESDRAVVGGVNLMLAPNTTVSLAKLGALSPDGRCKTFDASADGYGRGEGCGAVVLKRLSDALSDGDRVWAVLRGSAVNQDGRSAGLTVPNGQAQQAVIREALRDGGAEADDVGYVETHGTGTPLGDPMELDALVGVLRPENAATPLPVGSVKTNIGHLEAAAGISSLIKVALSLHHGQIPQHLHFNTPNSLVPWDDAPVSVPTDLTDWTRTDAPRMAGVSSFGFSGTNSHVILEEAPPRPDDDAGDAETAPQEDSTRAPQLLLLSARTDDALNATVDQYIGFLNDAASQPAATAWHDIVRTAALHRTHFPTRIALTAKSPEEAAGILEAHAAGESPRAVRVGHAVEAQSRRIVFAFSGQGSHWSGMGRSLLTEPVAAGVLRRCDRLIRDLAGWSVLDEMCADANHLDDTAVAQPALFAIQVALTELWRSWGVEPDAVVGHSVGEVAAAYAAGVFSLETALEVVVRRGQVMAPTRGEGAMVAVGASTEVVDELIAPYRDRLSVASVNSPTSCVLAGEPEALAELEPVVRNRRISWVSIQSEYAFHTPRMAPARDELDRSLRHIVVAEPRRPFFSTVTGNDVGQAVLDTDYWCENMLRPVRFMEAVRASTAADKHNIVVEIGPHSVLRSAVVQSLDGRASQVTSVGSMRRGADGRATMLDAAGALHVLGHELACERIAPADGRHTSLPTYPWQRGRYWLPERPVSTEGEAVVPREGEDDEALTGNCYDIEWHDSDAPTVPVRDDGADHAGLWLLVMDKGGVATRVAERLRTLGHACELLDPSQLMSDAKERIRELTAGSEVRGLLHCATLDADTNDAVDLELDAALETSCAPVLLAPHVLGTTGTNAEPRLWVVTRGATAVDDSPVAPPQAPAWGLARVVGLEHPEIWGGLVDLDPAQHDPATDAAVIVSEVLVADDEEQVAYRDGARRVARLCRTQAPDSVDPDIGADGSYLITGGRGALGLRVAEWLADQGACHLVLTGRRPLSDAPDDPAAVAVQALRERGVTVHTPAVDVADEAAMQRVLGDPDAPWPTIRGVVHAAGLFEACAVADMSMDRLRAVLRAKVEGTIVLDRLFAEVELDFFVMFSSAASVWGSALGGHYVAANYFQDLMAHDRVRRGLPGLAVNWGWWAGSDMVPPDHVAYFESMGLSVLPDEVGFRALERLLGSGRTQMTVAPVEWGRFRPVLEAKRRRPLLDLVATDGSAEAGSTADLELLGRLTDAMPGTRRRLLEERLQREVAAVLGRDSGELDREFGFFEAGMDSITSVELKTRLERALGIQLAATVAFEHPSIAALADHMLAEMFPPHVDAEHRDLDQETPDSAATADSAPGVDELSEEELLQLLDEELRGK